MLVPWTSLDPKEALSNMEAWLLNTERAGQGRLRSREKIYDVK